MELLADLVFWAWRWQTFFTTITAKCWLVISCSKNRSVLFCDLLPTPFIARQVKISYPFCWTLCEHLWTITIRETRAPKQGDIIFNKDDIYEVFWLHVRLFANWCAGMYQVSCCQCSWKERYLRTAIWAAVAGRSVSLNLYSSRLKHC